jgi:pimeloyl-ACP methyl ester carboxylesterase
VANTRVPSPSGRWLGFFGTGDPLADRLVVLCHPTPGCATFDPDPLITDRWGVHLVGLDRPGYGASDPLDDPSESSMVERAEELARFIEQAAKEAGRVSSADFSSVGVVGWGAGGAVAAALAERHPEHVDRLALVGTPAPRDVRKTARRAMIAPASREALHVQAGDPDLDGRLGLGNRLDRMIEEAFRQGKAGIEADRHLMADAAWSRKLGTIRADTALFYGALDPGADESDGRWFQRHIRGARLNVAAGSGPLVIAAEWEAILAHVAPDHGSIPGEHRDSGQPRLPRL